MFGLKPMEVVLIVGFLIFLFGIPKLAGIGKAVGASLRDFKKAFSGDEAPTDGAPPSQIPPGTAPAEKTAAKSDVKQV